MKLPNLLPKWIADKSSDPEGTAPKSMITKAGLVLGVVLMGAVLLVTPSQQEQAASEDEAVTEELPPPAGPEGPAAGERSIDEAAQLRQLEAERAERERQAATETAERLRQMNERYARARQGRGVPAGDGGSPAMGDAGVGYGEMTPEQELRQSIRLGEIQRRHDSLRAAPVALSLRGNLAAAPSAPALPAVETTTPLPVAAPPAQPEPAPVPPREQQPTTRAEQALEEGEVAAATPRPQDPRGWERIDGGQWIEAVLVTQIRGDAPGPAIALVSTPFWSRDRQRILIPRGARFVGRAMAVSNWEQARLSVTFDRLIFEDYNLRLRFAGLSQAGEAGLKDQVNRHYLATFGAAGAVGVISGLTLRNTQSFGFNVPAGQAARMEAGRSLGQSASEIMNRYLNRLPTITIRAGHRIRVYFTSDLLVPRRPA